MPKSKTCIVCGATFSKDSRYTWAKWAKQRFCGRRCTNTHTARQQRHGLRMQRIWAASWERQRKIEDCGELKAWNQREKRRQQRIERATRPLPGPRHWMAGTCAGCGEYLIFIQKGQWNAGSRSYCDGCRKKRWRLSDRQRARHFGCAYEPINNFEVFAADDYRCQLCNRKTTGKYPHPRSPSLDHIIPLALGGPHLLHNVQTACLECNVTKGIQTANDQLRLALA